MNLFLMIASLAVCLVSFDFGSGIPEGTMTEYRYQEDTGVLNIYVSGNKNIYSLGFILLASLLPVRWYLSVGISAVASLIALIGLALFLRGPHNLVSRAVRASEKRKRRRRRRMHGGRNAYVSAKKRPQARKPSARASVVHGLTPVSGIDFTLIHTVSPVDGFKAVLHYLDGGFFIRGYNYFPQRNIFAAVNILVAGNINV